MFNNRTMIILAGTAMLAIAAVTFQATTRPTAVMPDTAQAASNVVALPSGEVPLVNLGVTDYYQTQRDSVIRSQAVESDWFQRHPEALNAASGDNLSDYFQRHPTHLKSAEEASTMDYFQRHPVGLPAGVDGGALDYIQRHPELLRSSNAGDLSDWFQRHPEFKGVDAKPQSLRTGLDGGALDSLQRPAENRTTPYWIGGE